MKRFDVTAIREDFPTLKQSINNKALVYLDNAATTQKPKKVIAAINDYYYYDNANVHRGVHALSQKATQAYEYVRQAVKDFINADSMQEIIFTKGTTEAINLVAQAFGRSFLQPGDEIIISHLEHHANIVPWQILCEQTGAQLKIIPINEKGEIVLDAYKNLLNKKTKIVAVAHISNALGTINPIKEMIALAHEYDSVTLIDGAQSAPHMSIDVQDLNCDFYTFSAHKAYGPTGTGVLYGKKTLLEKMPPYQGGGDMIKMVSFAETIYNDVPYKFEAGTPNIAGVIGMGAALEYIRQIGLDAIAKQEHELLLYATERAQQTPGLRLIGTADNKTSILSFVLDYAHPHDVGTILDNEGIAVRTGHHCAMPTMEFFKVPATVRASFVFYNTLEEVDALFAGLEQVNKLLG